LEEGKGAASSATRLSSRTVSHFYSFFLSVVRDQSNRKKTMAKIKAGRRKGEKRLL